MKNTSKRFLKSNKCNTHLETEWGLWVRNIQGKEVTAICRRDRCTYAELRICPAPSCPLESGLSDCLQGTVAHSPLCHVQGVSLTTARERGQLVFLEGLKSSVDVFFQPREEPHPLQFLRSVSLQPSPEVHTW